jgi:ribosomal protein L15E
MPPRRRVFRGLTSAGRKARGLRKKGKRRAFRQRIRIKKKLRKLIFLR